MRVSSPLQDESQPTLALPFLLQALQLSTLRSSELLRLRCIVRLVECRLALSPTAVEAARSLQDLEIEWGQFISLGREQEEDLLCGAKEVKARVLVLLREEKGGESLFRFRVLCATDADVAFPAGEDEAIILAADLLRQAHQGASPSRSHPAPSPTHTQTPNT